MGQHPIGLEHFERGSDDAALALEHLVDLGSQREDGGREALFLARNIVREQLLGRHRRLVQHGHAEGQAFGQAHAAQPLGPVGRDLDVLEFGLPQQVALGHRLGQHHGDDLQILDLVIEVIPLGAVLHHQHADRASAAQQGNAQEGVVGIFTRLWPIGEGRVLRRVGEAEWAPQPHDLADQPFAGLHARDVDRAGLQALGGEQLHVPRRPAQIDRAYLGHHRAGDDLHHHVELGLGRSAAGHGFADLPEQAPWRAYAGRQGHLRSSLPGPSLRLSCAP